MWISRKKWNSLKAEIESQKIIKEATDKTLNEYRDRNDAGFGGLGGDMSHLRNLANSIIFYDNM